MKTTMISTSLLVLAMSSQVMAQVPQATVRPGLNLSTQVQDPMVNGQYSQGGVPTANLVQRNYNGTQAQGAPAGGQASSEEFFYVDDGAAGPDNLAAGLSTYNDNQMTQAGAQLSGDYGAAAGYGALPAGQIQDAWNRPFDNMSAGQSAPGTVRYQWTADLIMPVRLRAGMVTSIILPDWDAAQDVIIGDPTAAEASILRPNQVAVKSVQTGLDTSLSITGGSGNVYTFYLRNEGRNTKIVSDMQVFVQAAPSRGSREWFSSEKRNAYSAGPAKTASATSDDISVPGAASQGDEPVPTDRRKFNLKMYEVHPGDRAIAPEYAYTDGRFTYLHFSAGVTDRPAIFRIVDGVEGRVNTRVSGRHGEVIVVEAIGDLILRSGTRAVCVVTVDKDENASYRR